MKLSVLLFSLICCVILWPGTPQRAKDAPNAAPVSRKAEKYASSARVSSFTARRRSHATRPRVAEIGHTATSTAPGSRKRDADSALARVSGVAMPTPGLSFDGLSNFDNIAAYNAVILPPDMVGDVGPSHYVQAVNALVRVFNKTGDALSDPFRMSELFNPLGTACSSRDDGEPVVLYDQLADRWILTQYCNNFPPFRQMIAVSKNGDPLGEYHLYEFVMPNIRLNDFAKLGVWPDGYYMSTEEFIGSDYVGMGMFAFDRNKMLAGDPSAAYIYFSRPSLSTARRGNLLPSDLDGLAPPAPGSPNIFVGFSATEYGEEQDALRLFDFHADFAFPASSTFIERPESPLSVAAFDPTSPEGRADITQPAPGDKLDANSDRLNYRAAYRARSGGGSIVLNQTVRLQLTPYRAGVRLYQLHNAGAGFAVTEQTTIGDTLSSRWIGSAAEDHEGNIGVGYNLVADDKQPSVYYTGRLDTEPAGTFRTEASLIDGTGVQKAFGWRWGDYTSMAVDPVDECTFWMTGEYYTLASQKFSDYTWLTRIGHFRFPECTDAPRGTISGQVTDALTGQPIAGGRITASAYGRVTASDGSYGPLALVPGQYLVTADAPGYQAQTATLSIANGQAVTHNVALQPVPVFNTPAVIVTTENCGTNGAPEPGETVTVSITLQNTGALPTTDLVATLLSGGGVTAPGPPQNYGSLSPMGPPVSRPFSFTVAPDVICGTPLTLTLALTDGSSQLGNITTSLQTGELRIAFRESFDRAQLAQLPPRWSRAATNRDGLPDHPRNWTVSSKRSTSPSKAAFSPDLNQIGVNEGVTPSIQIRSTDGRVTFNHWYELESTFLRNRLYDGSVMEMRVGEGEWQDIIAAGGVFESGGYDGIIDSCCQNPLGGRPGWSGRSGINQFPEFVAVTVRLPASAVGHLVQLRWRIGTDVGGSREGQYIDDLTVTDGFVCDCATRLGP